MEEETPAWLAAWRDGLQNRKSGADGRQKGRERPGSGQGVAREPRIQQEKVDMAKL